MSLRLTNTLTRTKERFVPADPDRVTMYVCGPTVYDYAHVGNARSAVVFDMLHRVLMRRFTRVVYARNVTDVDDKINAAARAAEVPISAVTGRFLDAYHADMAALGVGRPTVELRVTDHIPDIVAMIGRLLTAGKAYDAEGHVLFHVPSFPDYGRLSRRSPSEMIAGARVEVAPFKRHPADFVLWKPSTPDLPGWDSPWGRGRPGWHIECSSMIGRHLGGTIDLHGGGQDLIFPHHENEIAQGTCAHDGRPYCRVWVHNGFVTVEGRKMSKSLGNVRLVRDLLADAPGPAIRLALLTTHYRRTLDWTARRCGALAGRSTACAVRSMRSAPSRRGMPGHGWPLSTPLWTTTSTRLWRLPNCFVSPRPRDDPPTRRSGRPSRRPSWREERVSGCSGAMPHPRWMTRLDRKVWLGRLTSRPCSRPAAPPVPPAISRRPIASAPRWPGMG